MQTSLNYNMAERDPLQGSSVNPEYSHGDRFDEANELFEIELSSMLESHYPDYLFVTEHKNEQTFNAIRLIVGGGFPNTNWITVAYYLENYSESDSNQYDYDSFTFGCVYKENVVKGPEIYHVGTYYIDNSSLLNLETEFRYHDDVLTRYVQKLDKFIYSSRQTVQERNKYMKELVNNKVEIVPYATAGISQLNYFKSKVLLMRKLKEAQDLMNSKKKGDPVGDTNDFIISNLRDQLAIAKQNQISFADKQRADDVSLGYKSKMDEYEARIKELNENLIQTKLNEEKLEKNVKKLDVIANQLEKETNKILQEKTVLLHTISKHNEDNVNIKKEVDEKTKQVNDLKSQIGVLERGLTSDEKTVLDLKFSLKESELKVSRFEEIEKEKSDLKQMMSKDAELRLEVERQLEESKAKFSELTKLLSSDQKTFAESSVMLEETKKELALQVFKFQELNADNLKTQQENIEALAKVSAQDIVQNDLLVKIAQNEALKIQYNELSKRTTNLQQQNFTFNTSVKDMQELRDEIVRLKENNQKQNKDIFQLDKLKSICKDQSQNIDYQTAKLDKIKKMVESGDFDNIANVFRIYVKKEEDENKKPDIALMQRLANLFKYGNTSQDNLIPIAENEPTTISPADTVVSETIQTNLVDGTVTINSLKVGSDGIKQDSSIQVRTPSKVGNMQYNEMRNLLMKKVDDISDQIVSDTYTGFYSKHVWTCNIRDCLASMERTEMHDLIENFTEPLDMDNARMYELFQKIDKEILTEIPANQNIKFLKNGLLRLLKNRYKHLEENRENFVNAQRASSRLQGKEA